MVKETASDSVAVSKQKKSVKDSADEIKSKKPKKDKSEKKTKKSTKGTTDKSSKRKRASEVAANGNDGAANGSADSESHAAADAAARPSVEKKRKTEGKSGDDDSITLDSLPAAIAERLRAKGITELFPIQQASYGPVKAGHDVVAQARTG